MLSEAVIPLECFPSVGQRGFNGIEVLPDDWTDIQEVQSLADSLRVVSLEDRKDIPSEWYTHLGT